MVERNHKAGQNPPRVVVPTEEEEEEEEEEEGISDVRAEIKKKCVNYHLAA
jgi:hypothetical protein